MLLLQLLLHKNICSATFQGLPKALRNRKERKLKGNARSLSWIESREDFKILFVVVVLSWDECKLFYTLELQFELSHCIRDCIRFKTKTPRRQFFIIISNFWPARGQPFTPLNCVRSTRWVEELCTDKYSRKSLNHSLKIINRNCFSFREN